jgi:hypothetical protein
MSKKIKQFFDRWWRHMLTIIFILIIAIFIKVEIIDHKQNVLLEANNFEIEHTGRTQLDLAQDTAYLKQMDSIKLKIKKVKQKFKWN